ncbi:P-loop containing nucleoside triphosphate hydrolase protein [Ceratobasidium sp. AG-I]|nr:P-loop containing nucleoside triphosphate hydrolase protein [Ceratobasidium sp. AG-I]
MPRKVAFSAKQRKAQLQEKRAIKRGDLPAPEPDKNAKKSRRRRGPAADSDAALAAAARSRMLVSSFLKPSAEFLEASKQAAATKPLERPVPESARILGVGVGEVEDQGLICPRRPKWRYEMTKNEVEKNEQGQFEKWIAQTDDTITAWRKTNMIPLPDSDDRILPAPTYYERNIEVWRQLWRVCELSSILMLLLDARCPPLHYPPSLDAYIKSLRPARQVILVLTKIDIVGEECANAWRTWLKERYGGSGIQVVGVQSYEEVSYGVGQGSRMKHLPHMPTNLLDELCAALKTAHEALLEPPSRVKEDPEKLSKWRPMVRTQVNWEAIGHRDNDHEIVAPPSDGVKPEIDGNDNPPAGETDEDAPSKEYLENRFLTVGLIGQPNVGKSSLLNALFGEHKVKASRTPGKTKHFQTMFLTPEIRLVDCPGLVFPALVPMELQVLSNILPIAQIPALPACIRYVGNLMPIESVFGVDQNLLEPEKVVEDKRTWRAGTRPTTTAERAESQTCTATQIMNAYATKRGWMTARSSWPDAMRAGNAMMRTIVEGRVAWAFWPPGSNPPASALGILTKSGHIHEDHDDVVSTEDERNAKGSEKDESSEYEAPPKTDDEDDESEAEVEEVEEPSVSKATTSRFAALGVTEDSEDEDEDE